METTRGPYHPTRFRDVAVTLDFHCNSACRFCIVQEGMNRFKGLPWERFAALVAENARSRKYDRVIFTGGEVTLEKNLGAWVRHARDSGAFAHLRLQTNGRRLADAAFARALVADGLDEFFVSLHGHDAATHDDITQRPGSFDELVAGLRNLRALGVRVITNTVITRRNVRALAAIVELAADHGVTQMDFWNYLPMEDQRDERDLIAPLDALMPALGAALDRCRARGVTAVTKYVPRCLLGAHAETLDNGQPDVVIVESFWDTFPRFSCLYEAVCEHSERCLGLHHAYVNKYGWEERRLEPTPRTTPWAERDALVEGRPDEPAARPEAPDPAASHPRWGALVEGAVDPSVGRLAGVQLTRTQVRYRFETGRGASVDLVLTARDEGAPALARSRSFNVFYTNLANADAPSEHEGLKALLAAVVARVCERDDGSLSLDARKGLLQVLPPARPTRRAPGK